MSDMPDVWAWCQACSVAVGGRHDSCLRCKGPVELIEAEKSLPPLLVERPLNGAALVKMARNDWPRYMQLLGSGLVSPGNLSRFIDALHEIDEWGPDVELVSPGNLARLIDVLHEIDEWTPDVEQLLLKYVDHESLSVREAAVSALVRSKSADVQERLQAVVDDASEPASLQEVAKDVLDMIKEHNAGTSGGLQTTVARTCDACNGTGDCLDCKGTGTVLSCNTDNFIEIFAAIRGRLDQGTEAFARLHGVPKDRVEVVLTGMSGPTWTGSGLKGSLGQINYAIKRKRW